MDYKEFMDAVQFWFHAHLTELIVSLCIVLVYFISNKVARRLVRRHGAKNLFDKSRMLYVMKVIGLANLIVFAVLLGFTWGITLSGLSFYFASVFTIVGVALFANWSILSNLTASVILFFFFPYKIGTRIRIQDGDNSVEGLILDITMFYIKIETTEGKVVSYPNNLAIQKPFFY